LTNLVFLHLEGNRLTSLPGIERLTNLECLDLYDNHLTTLPDIGRLNNLEILDLHNNRLTNCPTIRRLTLLRSLNLSYNQITSIPRTIENLTNLQELDLSSNQITSIPASIGELNLDKSFEPNIRSNDWDYEKNGKLTPRHITRSSGRICHFICVYGHSFSQKINYVTNGGWCSVCCNSKRLCLNEDCKKCFNNSFASHPNAIYWNYEKNKQIPREVFRCNNNKFWFSCIVCNHDFDIALNHVSDGKWYKYCKGNDLCDKECDFCYNKSFASCSKSNSWIFELNELTPRQVCKNSGKKCWFKCEFCHTNFNKYLPDVVGGHWCPHCKNKTESKLFNILSDIYPSLIRNFTAEWCKNKRYLPFDFCIPEFKIIIELDGRQHFEQVRNWRTPIIQYKNDKYKEKCANHFL